MRFIFILVALLFMNNLLAQELPEISGSTLRELVESKFPDGNVLIGGTTGSWAFRFPAGKILDREFSYVTPENDFKQRIIKPSNDAPFNWRSSDAWVQHIKDNGQILRIHGPVGPQCSRWAKEDDRTPEELEKNMEEFFTALCKRYNGVNGIEYIDVVNETVENGKWHREKPGTDWQCPWYIIGQDSDSNHTPLYIRRAFEIAKEFAPDLKLIYNQHSHPDEVEDWELIKETIIYLRSLGLRVDGIGWQAHVDLGWVSDDNLELLSNLIDWAHNNDLEFHITEASVWIKDEPTAEKYIQQGADYSAILKVLLSKRDNGIVGWNTWHTDDLFTWNRQWVPALFDENYKPKPAYFAVRKVLENVE